MTKILVNLNYTPMGQTDKNINKDNNNEVAEEKAAKDTNVEGIDTEHNAENEEEATGENETDALGNFKKSADDGDENSPENTLRSTSERSGLNYEAGEKLNPDTHDKSDDPEIETGEALDGALNNPAAPSGTGKQVSNSKGKGVPDGDGGSIERESGIIYSLA